MTSFTLFWSNLQAKLKVGESIKNWTAFGGYLGDSMKVAAIHKEFIEIDTPNARIIQVVPKNDFEKVWEV
ncbi:MAG: hypothetical protein ABIJ65_02860, partial [Chloroflexota bacterium]